MALSWVWLSVLEEHVYRQRTHTQWTSTGLIFQILFKDSCRIFHLFISELRTTRKHYDLKPQHLFIFIMGLKLGQGLAVALPCSVSWWDSPRTDWRMYVQGAHSCDYRLVLAVNCELIQDWQPGVFFLSRGLQRVMEAGLQERLFKETGSGSWPGKALSRIWYSLTYVILYCQSIERACADSQDEARNPLSS